MKKRIILVCVTLFSIGLLSTVFSSCRNQTNNNNDVQGRDRDYVSNNNDDKERAGRCRPQPKEGGSCDNDDECIEQCDDLFGGRDYDECIEDFSVNEVQGMWYAFDDDEGLLEDPEEDELEDIHSDAIRNALSLDGKIWDSFINGYSTSEAKDVLYWIANDKCIYEAIADSFDADDTEGFIADLFEQADNSGLISAALEPLGEDPDDEDTFLYLAERSENDNARDLVHELLWEECLQSVPAAEKRIYDAVVDDDHKNSACLLGELYCKQDDDGDYIFEDVFEVVVGNELDDFIRGGDTGIYTDGLGIKNSDDERLEEVCTIVCQEAQMGGIELTGVQPSTCP